MKQNISFLLLIIFFSLSIQKTNAQCLDFVKTDGFEKLNTELYVPEGRFDALTLSEGDNLKVYKSFFRGRTYKVVVTAEENIDVLNFQVKTMQGELIFDNSQSNNIESWEYTSDKNQNLMITVELPSNSGSQIETGCVAVILGYKI